MDNRDCDSDIVSEDISVVNRIVCKEIITERLEKKTQREGNQFVNIPPITSIDNALHIYYSNSEIGNKEISDLFGRLSSATISRLKNAVRKEMDRRGIHSYGLYKVNTAVAFGVWGIDVTDLEKRRKKLKDLNLQ